MEQPEVLPYNRFLHAKKTKSFTGVCSWNCENINNPARWSIFLPRWDRQERGHWFAVCEDHREDCVAAGNRRLTEPWPAGFLKEA